jgi:hypothetical protein
MERDIRDVKRCSRCQEVVQALVHDSYLDDAGEQVQALFWLPRRKHTDKDCDRMLTIAREEWPTLW